MKGNLLQNLQSNLKTSCRPLHTWLFVTLLGSALLAAPAVQGQTTWYVDDNAPADPGPGDPTVSDPAEDGSADHPFDAIQEGIDAAVDGDTVLVTDGTYTGEGNKDLDYAGRAITVCSENGPETCLIDCEGDGRGFRFHSGEDGLSVLQGFAIASGYDDGAFGGGISCWRASPRIAECVVSDCEACAGGGISCHDSDALITDCTIALNTSTGSGSHRVGGGGILCWGGSPQIVNCVIQANTDAGGGGGLLSYGADVTIAGCTIAGNEAPWGAGIHARRSSLSISGCTFVENAAGYRGGACYAWGGELTIADSAFFGNTAVERGGAVFVEQQSDLSVVDSTFVANGKPGEAGAIEVFDRCRAVIAGCVITASGNVPIYCTYGSDVVVSNCAIVGNLGGAVYGYLASSDPYEHQLTVANSLIAGNVPPEEPSAPAAAIDCDERLTIANCTIVGNAGYGYGGAVCCDKGRGTVEITNSIVWGNADPNEPEIIVGSGDEQGPFVLTMSYNDVRGGPVSVFVPDAEDCTLHWNPGNIDVEPVFIGGPSGTLTASAAYDADAYQVTFTDASADWVDNELVGKLLNADLAFDFQLPIVANTESTVTTWANPHLWPPDYGDAGREYQVHDYRLGAGSPCIDAGCNCGVPPDIADLDADGDTAEYTPFDLDGEGRFFDDPDTPDTGSGLPPVVDMGAYEFGGSDSPPCFGDLDGDRDVDTDDLLVLLDSYGTAAGAGGADGDFNCDGDVDLSDLAWLLGVYGTTCP